MALPRFEVFTGAKRQLGPTRHLVGLTLTLDGADGLQAVLAALGPKAIQAARAPLYEEAETIMTNAKVITPVEWGNLRASGHVTLPTVFGGIMSVELGFGGPAGIGNQGETNREDVGYAIIVHEDLMARHNPGQQAKYLEQPALEAAEGMEGRLADALRPGLMGR